MTIKINPGVKLGPGAGVKVPVPPPTLTVNIAGSGNGYVVSSPTGIAANSSTSHVFALGTSVTLSASPAMGSNFAGWSGAASGTGSANITMNQNHTVTATFNLNAPPPTLVAITITPLNPSVARDGTIQLNATGIYSNGGQTNITSQVLWSSDHSNIASINGSGLVTGQSGGSCIIAASLNGVQASVTLFVGS